MKLKSNAFRLESPQNFSLNAKNKKTKRLLLRAIIVGLAIFGIILITILIVTKDNNQSSEEKSSTYSDDVAEVNPTTYQLEEETSKSLTGKFDELMSDNSDDSEDAVYDYFAKEINQELSSGDKKQACKILWLEHDLFMEKGLPQYALEALLKIDDTQLEEYQKIYLYRSIVTTSVIVGDKDTEDKYTALVIELDPTASAAEEAAEEISE